MRILIVGDTNVDESDLKEIVNRFEISNKGQEVKYFVNGINTNLDKKILSFDLIIYAKYKDACYDVKTLLSIERAKAAKKMIFFYNIYV